MTSNIRSRSLERKVWLLDQSKSGKRAIDSPAPLVQPALLTQSYLTTGGLISESFSLRLKFQKMVSNHNLSTIHQKKGSWFGIHFWRFEPKWKKFWDQATFYYLPFNRRRWNPPFILLIWTRRIDRFYLYLTCEYWILYRKLHQDLDRIGRWLDIRIDSDRNHCMQDWLDPTVSEQWYRPGGTFSNHVGENPI